MNICAIINILGSFGPISQSTMLAGLAAGVGLCFLFWGLRLFARRIALSRISAPTIRGASPGFVAISGTATGPYTLNAPVSGKPCYISQTTVWQQSGRSKSGPWQQVAEETLYLPFFIQDSTGQLLIEPLEAELDVPEDLCAEYGPELASPIPNNVPLRVSIFLARHNIALGFPLRIEERIVAPATSISITGTVNENPGIRVRPFLQTEDSQAGHPRHATAAGSAKPVRAPEIIRLSNGPGPASIAEMTPQGKIAAALARAGIAPSETWSAGPSPSDAALNNGTKSPSSAESACSAVSSGGASTQSATLEIPLPPAAVTALKVPAIAASDEQGAESDTGSSFDPAPRLILMKGDDNPTFVISCHSQQERAHSLGWRSVSMVVGGAALAALGLYGLLFQWHVR